MIRCANRVHQALNAGQHAHHETVAQTKVCQMIRPVRSIEETQLDAFEDAMWELEMRNEDHAMEAHAGV